jgi:hypothetical protein
MHWIRLAKPLPISAFLLLAVALWSVFAFRHMAGVPAGGLPPSTAPASEVARLRNASFQVEGLPVTLADGVSETAAAPGSAARVVTRYFGNEATGDLDGDGVADAAFLITQTRGGSGTFFYVVAAVANAGGYAGTNAVLLGDRVAPQSVRVSDRALVVTYAERGPGAAMTDRPSVGVSKTLRLVGTTLAER